jgi:hypothetical protein
MLTKSEALFLQYCNLRGYVANCLSAPAEGGRFPDYEVFIDQNRIVAEIKELRANPADKEIAEAIQQRRIQAFGGEIGRRVRTHIEDAEHQLRRYENQAVPCLVVLYDNIIVNGSRPNRPELFPVDLANPLYPGHIDVGMYGHQVVNIRIHPTGQTESLGDVRGGKRTLRPGHQTNISAVATLHVYDSKDRQLEKPVHPDSCLLSWQRVQIRE